MMGAVNDDAMRLREWLHDHLERRACRAERSRALHRCDRRDACQRRAASSDVHCYASPQLCRGSTDGPPRQSRSCRHGLSLLQETEKAWRLDTGDKTVWLPKSQCELDVDPASGHGTVTLPEWLALEKEII
jgi:hypothetical protein